MAMCACQQRIKTSTGSWVLLRNTKSISFFYIHPAQSLPRIISSSSASASIEAIRSYFTDEQTIRGIAGYVGLSFDTLTDGDYKIVIEPIAYFYFNGLQYAMTATEAALYDQMVNGGLRAKMLSLTHKNLPLAIFLEKADLGYAAWSGSRTQSVSNAQIISSLGIGVVRFNELTEPPAVDAYDYEYRVDTDVISSVTVSGGQADPDNPVSVRFLIQGTPYTVGNVYYPDGDSQLVWVKWHTPSTPCVITIQVSVTGGGSAKSTVNCNVTDLAGKDPPNPVADDRNNSFTRTAVPSKGTGTTASWGIWSPRWHINWVWHPKWEKCWHSTWVSDGKGGGSWDDWYHWVDNGEWVDDGWWEFDYNGYTASLSASMDVAPDGKSPTASAQRIKSGYGVQESVAAGVSTTQSSAVTAAQNAVTYFPEFQYQGFWRLLDRSVSGRSSSFQFKQNHYSTYNRRTHFTPIWYPDGAYTPYSRSCQCVCLQKQVSARERDCSHKGSRTASSCNRCY